MALYQVISRSHTLQQLRAGRGRQLLVCGETCQVFETLCYLRHQRLCEGETVCFVGTGHVSALPPLAHVDNESLLM